LWKNKRDISGLLLDILKGKAEYDLVQSENLLSRQQRENIEI
jgi:hypothetical protein